MISDILFTFTAVAQMRDELSRSNRIRRELHEHGAAVTSDEPLRRAIYDVVDQMERLARRLLTESVGPVTQARQ
jgi:hypothetical protein